MAQVLSTGSDSGADVIHAFPLQQPDTDYPHFCVFSAKNLANASLWSGCQRESAGRFSRMSCPFHSIRAASVGQLTSLSG